MASWRNQGITGSNNIPLGNRRRFGGREESVTESEDGHSDGVKRGRSSEVVRPERTEDDRGRKRKKRNRWGDASENKAANLTGLRTMVTANMTNEQLEAYTLHLRIEEISQKLRINDVVPADGDRSPSPAPQYDNQGRRVNTREYRYRKRLEDERHKLIEKAMKTIPNYHPPSDYRRPTKTQEKVYVPVNDYPEINFIGLLIGPRGNTLKDMESKSGAKIAIRGKGSVKEGKGRSDAAHTSNQEEDLHCLIMADTEDKVNKAKKLIHNIIETCSNRAKRAKKKDNYIEAVNRPVPSNIDADGLQAASIPEGQNELKRKQLRDLATLNGTLRDDENQACQNCGQIGHRKYDCPEARNFTSTIICRVCGNAGHMAKDCPDRARGSDWRNGPPSNGARPGGNDAVDREYAQLMQELSGGGPVGSGDGAQRIEAGPGGYDSQGGRGDDRPQKPWERGPTGAPAPWQQRGNDNFSRDGGNSSGGPPPWAGGGRGGNNYGYGQQGGYGAPPPPGGAAPWQQQAPPPPPGDSSGYGGYNYPGGGYNDRSQQNLEAPPGLNNVFQGYGGSGGPPPPPPPGGSGPPPPPPPSGGAPPPPPPPGAAPPPPPSEQPPPPPPRG